MICFLERIARLAFDNHRDELRDHCFVFPTRRAGLYFLKYLAGKLEKPVWAPSVMTINEFFGSLSDLTVAETEILLFELYMVYRGMGSYPGGFDEFYFWGDLLINDFDDVDKYMVSASSLFRNVVDYRTIDSQFGDLDESQAEIIGRFWKNFEPGKETPEKEGFRAIWAVLPELYKGFRESLRKKNICYEGMIFRDVAESLSWRNISEKGWKHIHFAGFNALNKCEITIMEKLKKEGRASFYWDYDLSYINRGKLNSAGFFMKDNLKRFGNDMPSDWNYETNLSSAARNSISRIVIESTSDIAQVKLVPGLVEMLPAEKDNDDHNTAIVLADENLIVPLLTSLPENAGDVNITMGYPLKMTDIYSLVKNIMLLQRDSLYADGKVYFSYRYAADLFKHRLIGNMLNEEEKNLPAKIKEKNLLRVPSDLLCINPFLTLVFSRPSGPEKMSEYLLEILSVVAGKLNPSDVEDQNELMEIRLQNEFIYRVMLSINRLNSIVSSPEVSFSTTTYLRILDKILRNQSVPFSGEPLSGIQVMGFLETRALDFRNVIILSVNEGILPTSSYGSSFIPYSLREAFGLPVINHKESVYAYHFFRLLHQAGNVVFIYNSDSSGLKTGEMSRFLIQMKYEKLLDTDLNTLHFDIKNSASISSSVGKSDISIERLYSVYVEKNNLLSPTALNTWLGCRMRFYYRYVNRIREPEDLLHEIDPAVFGRVLHGIMKSVYDDYINTELTPDLIDSIIRNGDLLSGLTSYEIMRSYNSEKSRQLSGSDIIIREVLMVYLRKILETDRTFAPFTLTGLEKQYNFNMQSVSGGREINLTMGGTIDRIDRTGRTIRIVDYKTGETADKIGSVDDLFADDRKKDLDGWLQTLLYCEAYSAHHPDATVRPSIYKVRDLSGNRDSDILVMKDEGGRGIPVEDYSLIRPQFLEGLRGLVNSIFDPEEPFRMTTLHNKCNYCPYRELCQR